MRKTRESFKICLMILKALSIKELFDFAFYIKMRGQSKHFIMKNLLKHLDRYKIFMR